MALSFVHILMKTKKPICVNLEGKMAIKHLFPFFFWVNNYLTKRDFHINLTLAAIVEFESNSDSQKFKVAHHELVVLVAINLVSK